MVPVFILTMPSNSAWNGKWTGEGKLYARARKGIKAETITKIMQRPRYTYSFGDGWVAAVEVKLMTGAEASKLMKKSEGFCGYDWMIDEILKHQKITGE